VTYITRETVTLFLIQTLDEVVHDNFKFTYHYCSPFKRKPHPPRRDEQGEKGALNMKNPPTPNERG
jgi:hypothetical protein